MVHIFISYSHEDSDFAEILKGKLEEKKFEVWTDESRLTAGEDWREGIDQAIREALALIVVMTPTAKASEYVTYEWAFAWGVGVKVIPILLKSTAQHPRLEALQFLDFMHSPARPWGKLINLIIELSKTGNPKPIRTSKGVPAIIQKATAMLDSLNEGDRRGGIDILAQSTHPIAREVLISSLKHHLRGVRLGAVGALVRIGDAAAVPGLIDALRDENSKVRQSAVGALGQIGDAAAVPGLIDALRDEDSEVRLGAIRALVQIGDAAVPGLIDGLRDENSGVRLEAAEILKEFNTPEAREALKGS